MLRIALSFIAVTALSCKGAPTSKPEMAPAGHGTGTGMCVLLTEGAQLSIEDGVDAVIVMVDASAQKRRNVRTAVRGMAARHEDRRYAYQRSVRHREAMPEHTTSVEFTDTGARVTYRPLSPDQLGALRRRLQTHLDELPGRCGSVQAAQSSAP